MRNSYLTLAVCLAAGSLAYLASAQTPTTPVAPPLQPMPSVTDANAGAQIKMDGRIFVGILSSGVDGAYPNRALDASDAKLRFTFTPNKDITIVNRFANSKATQSGFDYFYVDVNDGGKAHPGNVIRVGKMKMDTGEETWTDNPVESILITNSAAIVGGYDGGVNFRGPIVAAFPATYSLALYNNTGGVGSSTNGLGTGVKLGASPDKHLYISANYYDSGKMISSTGTVSAPPLKVANLQSVPTGATIWDRSVKEIDARWNYSRTGIKSTIPSVSAPAPFQIAAAYGHFSDEFTAEAYRTTGVADRSGNYYYIEALYNATAKLYVASRYSAVTLENDMTTKLVDSTVAVNSYKRFSLGAGYHMSTLSDVKAEVTSNTTSGGASQPKLNQVAVGVATKF